jgi:hypothetical protein
MSGDWEPVSGFEPLTVRLQVNLVPAHAVCCSCVRPFTRLGTSTRSTLRHFLQAWPGISGRLSNDPHRLATLCEVA